MTTKKDIKNLDNLENLDGLEYQELLEMQAKVEAALVNKKPPIIYEQFLKLADFLNSHNLNIKEFLEFGEQNYEKKNRSKKSPISISSIMGTKPKIKPKYQNGTDTWSGRGKTPKWLAIELNKGHTLEDFLIKYDDEELEQDVAPEQNQELLLQK